MIFEEKMKQNLIFILTGKNCVLLDSGQERLLGCFGPFSPFSQVLYILLLRTKEYRCLENVIHVIHQSQNEWLLVSASFKAKFG